MALSTVGPYRILERLGAGANGEVYLAEDTRLHRRVALKTLAGTARVDASELRRRLMREARAAARLNHPHIAAVYDVLETDEGVHIVMEYVRGTSLAMRLREGPPSAMQVLDIALQLASALAHAHSLGVIHRDLKPANIVSSADGQVKILDFGLARLEEVEAGSARLGSSDLTSESVVRTVGTPPYIPPEHLGGAPVDARGDIYSLGVTLFELLTGRRPFEAKDGLRLFEAILTAPTPRPRMLFAEVPADLDAAVYRAMARNPADRYASAAELEADLKRVSAAISDFPTRSRAWSLVRRPGRRGVVRTAVAIVAVALGLFGAVTAVRRFSGQAGALAEATASAPKVVAVLPLAGAAGDPQTESLAAGVADSLITTLSKVSGLTVVSRAATLKYQDRKLEPDAIARELGATMLVDGRVQRSGDRLRITLSLTQPGAKVVRWQNAYDGTFAEVFALQREVADAVAGALRLEVAPARGTADARPTENVEAFADYSQARSFLERPDVKDNLDRSITLFQSAIKRDPPFARAHAGLGEAYWRKYQATREGKWSVEARDSINEALRLDPEDGSVRLSLAAIYRGMGRIPQATEELEKLAAASPGSDEAHRQLGIILVSQGQPERGLSELKQAIGLRPSYWVYHYDLGSAYYNLGRYREAVNSFQRVVELQPDSPWGHNVLGSAYHAMDDTKAAMVHYQKALGLGNARAHSNLGILFYDLGKFDDALPHFQESVRLEPNSPLKHHNLGDVFTRLGRNVEAIAAYKRAAQLCRDQMEVSPRDATNIATLAVLESKLGDAAQAERHAEQAKAMEPGNPDVLYSMAIVYSRANDKDRALAALEESLKAGYSRARAGREPELARLRSDPRYAAAMGARKTGGT